MRSDSQQARAVHDLTTKSAAWSALPISLKACLGGGRPWSDAPLEAHVPTSASVQLRESATKRGLDPSRESVLRKEVAERLQLAEYLVIRHNAHAREVLAV